MKKSTRIVIIGGLLILLIGPFIYAYSKNQVITLPFGWAEGAAVRQTSLEKAWAKYNPSVCACANCTTEDCSGNGMITPRVYFDNLNPKSDIFRIETVVANDVRVNGFAEFLNNIYLEMVCLILISASLFLIFSKIRNKGNSNS